MWVKQVCVAQQDMLFALPTPEQGIKLNLQSLEDEYILLHLTDWNRVRFFPGESPIILDHT